MAAAQPQMSHDYDVVEYGTRRIFIVIGVMMATLLQVLDATIVNVALPTIQGTMGANIEEGTWVITGYIIAAVIVIPLTPWLQTRFGRRRYYIAAIIGFTITSALCGISTSFWELVFFRVLQGLCGGGLIATGQAVLRDTFPPKLLGASQALNALGAIVGPSVGPTLGGILTDNLSWNWIFFINIVPGTLSAVLLFMLLRNPSEPRKVPVDGVGLSLMALGLGTFQYVLNEGESKDWFGDGLIVTLSIVSFVALISFVVWVLRQKTPIVDLRILKNRTVAAGCVLGASIGFALFGGVVLSPQFTQGVLHFTATLSGEMVLLRAIFIAGFTPVALIALNRGVSAKILLSIGFVLVAISSAMQALVTTSSSDFWTFGPAMIIGGIGLSQLFTPLSIAVLSAVSPWETPKAVALISLCQQLGGSISAAVLVTLVDRREAFHQSVLATHINSAAPAVSRAVEHQAPLAQIYGLLVQEATTLAFADAFWIMAAVTVLLTPLVFLLRPRRPRGPVAVPAE